MSSAVRFLLVEDNKDHAELIKQSFEIGRLANELDHVTSGEAAIAYLKAEGEFARALRPHVILLDLSLPGVSGLDVLSFVKHDPSLKTVPVVVLTTSNAERDRVHAYKEHANSFVTKPVDFGTMRDIVQQLGLYWSICNQAPA
jgi:CheY-like chemotaxis protein